MATITITPSTLLAIADAADTAIASYPMPAKPARLMLFGAHAERAANRAAHVAHYHAEIARGEAARTLLATCLRVAADAGLGVAGELVGSVDVDMTAECDVTEY